jgi:hypothetical protein
MLNSRQEENYERGFIIGYRIGRIEASRKILIRELKILGKPSRETIRKINFETDEVFLDKMIMLSLEKKTEIDKLESAYDEIMRTEDEFIAEEYSIYKDRGILY